MVYKWYLFYHSYYSFPFPHPSTQTTTTNCQQQEVVGVCSILLQQNTKQYVWRGKCNAVIILFGSILIFFSASYARWLVGGLDSIFTAVSVGWIKTTTKFSPRRQEVVQLSTWTDIVIMSTLWWMLLVVYWYSLLAIFRNNHLHSYFNYLMIIL